MFFFILLFLLTSLSDLPAQSGSPADTLKRQVTLTEQTEKDTYYLNVHFLYGSKPKRKYKKTEKKWFGGIWGGHVGIEGDSNAILNFCRKGKFHIFQHRDIHSCYKISSGQEFNRMYDNNSDRNVDSVKKLLVLIPVSKSQKLKFDSLQAAYMLHTPYDYAFLGMRCGAAVYDVLSSAGILKKMGYHKTWSRIFYPRRLRKRIIKLAVKNHWEMHTYQGSTKRKWEKD